MIGLHRRVVEGRAVVLFEARPGSAKPAGDTEGEIYTDAAHLHALPTLADRMGASVIVR